MPHIKKLLVSMLFISTCAHTMNSDDEVDRETVDAITESQLGVYVHVGSYLQRCQKEQEEKHLYIPCVGCGNIVPLMHEPCCNPYRGK